MSKIIVYMLTPKLQPILNPATHDVSIPLNRLIMNSYSLAISGDVFRWLIDYGTEDVVKRVSYYSEARVNYHNLTEVGSC